VIGPAVRTISIAQPTTLTLKQPGFLELFLEHFDQSCSAGWDPRDSGLFGLGLRFGSVTGCFKPAPSPKPRPRPKILAAQRYIFSVNAL